MTDFRRSYDFDHATYVKIFGPNDNFSPILHAYISEDFATTVGADNDLVAMGYENVWAFKREVQNMWGDTIAILEGCEYPSPQAALEAAEIAEAMWLDGGPDGYLYESGLICSIDFI